MRPSTSKSNSPGLSAQSQPSRPRFALDENFPVSILRQIVVGWTPELDLLDVRNIDGRLLTLDDHQLILALHQSGYEGLVTNDHHMLDLPEVLAIIKQTKFSVVACIRAGDDPLVATGVLLTHLRNVAKRHNNRTAQLWRLNTAEKRPEDFGRLVQAVEDRTGRRVKDYEVGEEVLARPVLF